MNFIIRSAQEGDASGIAKVHVETWQSAYKGQVPEKVLNDLSIEQKSDKWAKTIAANDPKKSLLVAVSREKIVGFCIVSPSRDADMPDFGELSAIYVSPAFQGYGVGLSLMNEGLDFLRKSGYSKAMLWVLKTNAATINFYEKCGWRADGAEKEEAKDECTLQEVRYRKEF